MWGGFLTYASSAAEVRIDHAHLHADEPPMYGDVYLPVYHEPDAWFDRLTEWESQRG